MYRALLLLPILCCCQQAPQSPWNCASGVKISRYIEKNGEITQFEVDYTKESARYFGRVINLHEDAVRYTDVSLFKSPNYIGFGNILINSNIMSLHSWSHGLTVCNKKKQYRAIGDEIAVVKCSDNRELGYVEYTFSRERGITKIKSGDAEEAWDHALLDGDGLGKFCNA